jgi:hypothetical protein
MAGDTAPWLLRRPARPQQWLSFHERLTRPVRPAPGVMLIHASRSAPWEIGSSQLVCPVGDWIERGIMVPEAHVS